MLSALQQSQRPAEVIVVDNGTRPADSAALPNAVTLHRLPPRIGVSRARNYGAAMARGTHLAFLDDDDWWDINFLREACAVLNDEGTRCAYGRLDLLRDELIEPFKCASAETLTVPVLLRRNPGTSGQNLIIEKALFWYVGGFDTSLQTSEDKALAVEVLRAGEKISVARSAIAIMRSHGGDRLSSARLRKLRFVWRYRALYGPLGALAEAGRILRQVSKDRLRGCVDGLRSKG